MSHKLNVCINFCFKLIINLLEDILETDENKVYKVSINRKSFSILQTKRGIYELIQLNERNRSFFIENTVCSNGKIYMATKFDPLFVFINLIEENCKPMPLDQLLAGNLILFQEHLKLSQMQMVANQKGPEDLKAFIYDENKTLKWLKIKFARIQHSLRQQKIITSGSTSLNFVQSKALKEEGENEDEIAATALGILSEYISLHLYEQLDNFYGVSEKSKEPIVQQKRKSEGIKEQPGSKKLKSEAEEVLRENTTVKSTANTAPKNAKLEKAAKGTKAITSFFTRK